MKKVRQIPLEDFFRNSEKSSYDISPNGQFFSFLAPWKERMNLFVQPVSGGDAVRITAETERGVAGYIWASDEILLFVKDVGGDENYQLWGVNRDGSGLRAYVVIEGVRVQILDDLEDVEDEILIETNERNPEIFDPYRLNLKTGERTLLAENPGNVQGWMTDHDGRLRVAYAIEGGVNTQILFRETEADDFRVVLTTNFKDSLDFLFFTFDNKNVYATTNIGRDKKAFVMVNPRTGEVLEEIFEHEKYDVSSAVFSKKKKKLVSVSCSGHQSAIRHFFDEEEKRRYAWLEAQLPGKKFGTAAVDKSREMRIIFAGNDRTRGAYFLFDTKNEKLTKIADLAPWILEEEMAPMGLVNYTTRDGLEIEGYLTLPLGADGAVPLVVLPHGGPWVRDYWGYDSEVQFLANRGYGVFQMNYRGSTGYGRRFKELSYKQWGRAMQDDITDGVRFLIENGVADDKRIAIYGGSYGGYAALMGAVKTPDLYACAVDFVGVSNLFTFMKTIPPYWKPLLEMMYEQVGNPETDAEMMRENSPVLNVEKIKKPIFIAQGTNDPRVNKAESDQMVQVLENQGIEVEYLVKNDEGHGFRKQENRFEFYEKMEKFLAKHLKK